MKESTLEREIFFQMEDSSILSERKCFKDGRMSFAERLCQLREDARISQEDLGKAIGSSGPTVHRWEKGSGGPSLAQAVEMAGVLKVDLYELAYGNSPDKPVSLPEDEAAVLRFYRSLKRTGHLDEDQAIAGLMMAAKMPDIKIGDVGETVRGVPSGDDSQKRKKG